MIFERQQILANNFHSVTGNPSSKRVHIELLTWIGLDVIDQRVMQLSVRTSKTFLSGGAKSLRHDIYQVVAELAPTHRL